MDLRNATQKLGVDKKLVEPRVDGLVAYSCVFNIRVTAL